jgi:hypothetical protein
MHQAESSSSSFCLWTGLSLPAALHPVSRRRSCLPLPTDQCFCPMRTFTPLLVRTFRRTSQGPLGRYTTPLRQHSAVARDLQSSFKVFLMNSSLPDGSGLPSWKCQAHVHRESSLVAAFERSNRLIAEVLDRVIKNKPLEQ